MAEMLSEYSKGTKHKDVQLAEVQKSENCVATVCQAITSFKREDKQMLYCITYGAAVSTQIEAGILQVDAAGKEAKESITDWLEK